MFLESDQVRSSAILRRTRPNAKCIIAPCVSFISIVNNTGTKLQSIEAQLSVNEKSGCLDVVFSGAYPTIASWVETGGRGIYPVNPSPTSIRNGTRSSEENRVTLRCWLKYPAHQ